MRHRCNVLAHALRGTCTRARCRSAGRPSEHRASVRTAHWAPMHQCKDACRHGFVRARIARAAH
eukprot:12584770-Alexandrium_andersonii.AAC.1